MVHCIYLGGAKVVILKEYCVSFSEDRFFLLSKNADLDKIPHNTAFYLSLHCLPKYQLNLEVSGLQMVNTDEDWVLNYIC